LSSGGIGGTTFTRQANEERGAFAYSRFAMDRPAQGLNAFSDDSQPQSRPGDAEIGVQVRVSPEEPIEDRLAVTIRNSNAVVPNMNDTKGLVVVVGLRASDFDDAVCLRRITVFDRVRDKIQQDEFHSRRVSQDSRQTWSDPKSYSFRRRHFIDLPHYLRGNRAQLDVLLTGKIWGAIQSREPLHIRDEP
jgi:hypothetical protein